MYIEHLLLSYIITQRDPEIVKKRKTEFNQRKMFIEPGLEIRQRSLWFCSGRVSSVCSWSAYNGDAITSTRISPIS